VLASVGSTGDAYDNSMAESFLDSLTTEFIADRVWRTRSQLDPAVVEYIAWFNDSRLHENLDDRPPREIEELYAAKSRPTTPQNPGCFYEVKGTSTSLLKRVRERCRLSALIALRLVFPSLMRRSR
jgi:hypothetical protein